MRMGRPWRSTHPVLRWKTKPLIEKILYICMGVGMLVFASAVVGVLNVLVEALK